MHQYGNNYISLLSFSGVIATGCDWKCSLLIASDCFWSLHPTRHKRIHSLNLPAGVSLPKKFQLPFMMLLPSLCPRQVRGQRVVNKPLFLFPPALLFSSSPSAFIFHSVLSFRKPHILYTELYHSLSHSLIYCPLLHHAAPSALPSDICSFPAAPAVLHLSSWWPSRAPDPYRRATIMAANLQLEPRHVHGATARLSQLHSPGG